MLVLSRRRDEAVYIGGDIKIVVVAIDEGKVRLGIEAPANVPVHRGEVYHAIRRQEESGKPTNRPSGAKP